MNYAWPTAEIDVMGGAGAVEVLYAREAKERENPAQFLAEKEAEYTKLFANPYNAAKYGLLVPLLLTLGAGLATGIGSAIAFFARHTNKRLLAFSDRKSTRLNSSHLKLSRMPSSA